MRAQGNGATILIVPPNNYSWPDFIRPGLEAASPDKRLSEAIARVPTSWQPFFMEQMELVATEIGRYTAIDGAVILNRELQLISFGAVLIPPDEPPTEVQIEHIGNPVNRVHPVKDLGGTRHQSAAKFCQQVPDAVAFVSSHDGPLTIFRRPPKTKYVLALRNAHYLID
jgi:DNA integrity scanning protein DisA with diadenylate cyclase activity